MSKRTLNRRTFLQTASVLGAAAFLPVSWPLPATAEDAPPSLQFTGQAKSTLGEWSATLDLSKGALHPGTLLSIQAELTLSPAWRTAVTQAEGLPGEYLLLITTERLIDSQGWMRFPADERMSTLLTPTGLAVEGGSSSAVSRYAGSRYKNPVDELVKVPVQQMQLSGNNGKLIFSAKPLVPPDIPPGIYRLRFDFGFILNKKWRSLNNEGFANRPRDAADLSLLYSPPLLCSNRDFRGKFVDAASIVPRIYWILLDRYNSNGYQGVVADEDKKHFALSGRNIIPDEVILPMLHGNGSKLAYNLEPTFPANLMDKQRILPLNPASGELSLQMIDPAGKKIDLGTAPFIKELNGRPTTGNLAFTAWKPETYGRYTVIAKGWIADTWNTRYYGGGTYHFWIAKRMTMGTATFQGMSFPVGARLGQAIGFSPAVPADVVAKADLYPASDPARQKTLSYRGKASVGGIFGPAQGMKPFVLEAPGEYHSHVLATYTDGDGHLWVCSMRHAGVVYPVDSPLEAHGKKLKIDNQYLDRGETHREGYVEPGDNFRFLDHINFPYQQGDCLLIASEGQGANKIEPVLTYVLSPDTAPYEKSLNSIGATNARILTTNGLSPHLYPEYISDWAYYYAAAPRPGLSSRFLVGENGVRAPYWPTSTSSFGGQIGASGNGDFPGDIYRLLGGVVLRRSGQSPLYAGYMASAFILPHGSNNNRIIAPGSEELIGADGTPARFFLVPVRPGMVYEQGALFTPVLQIDPIVPAQIQFTLHYPDGTRKTSSGVGDAFGYFVGADKWQLSQPGVYRYAVQATWQGFTGRVPGLTPRVGSIFVLEKNRPVGKGLRLSLKNQQTFPIIEGLLIEGTTTAESVEYTMITPGAVIEQGALPVVNGRFFYRFEPARVNQKIPIYDIENRRTHRKEIGRIIHFTFFAAEKDATGAVHHSYARVIMRGNTAIYAQ